MAEDVQSKFGLPAILENDVNAAVCGYVYREEIAEDQCVLAIYFSENSPPGMGIYLLGGVLKGIHGLAGEIKFLPSMDWDESKGTEVFSTVYVKLSKYCNPYLTLIRLWSIERIWKKSPFFIF